MPQAAVTQLKVDDESFLVASLIDRCPKTMMLRELVQNAIDAASLAPPGQRRIEIGATEIDGARKLGIWNTGPGLDEPSLHRMCDIAASIGKLKGLDRNFGMGAKVASLPSNHHGMRYRSCAGGLVHEVVIGKRDGVYGRVRVPRDGVGLPGLDRVVDIRDVTEAARAEGCDLSTDWTEVVLLGMRPEQDTVASPYDDDPVVPEFWLPEALYGRFFRVAPDIEIFIEPELTWRPTPQRFLTLAQRTGDFAGYECVEAGKGLKIHYFHDPAAPDRPWENASSEAALQTAMGQVGVVYRNEIYDRVVGSPWAYEAPNFGVTFGGRHVSIFIELPDDYPVRPDAYRQMLMDVSGEQGMVKTGRFAALALAHRPAWLIDVIEGMGGKRRNLDDVVDQLARLSGRLKLAALGPADLEAISTSKTQGEVKFKCGFGIELLRDEREINDRWLNGRAGCFYASTKELFVNTLYPSVAAAENELLLRLSDLRKSPLLDELVHDAVVDCLVTKVGRALLYGMAKHLHPETWGPGHVEKAMSPEALSVAADDLEDLLLAAEAKVRGAMLAATD